MNKITEATKLLRLNENIEYFRSKGSQLLNTAVKLDDGTYEDRGMTYLHYTEKPYVHINNCV